MLTVWYKKPTRALDEQPAMDSDEELQNCKGLDDDDSSSFQNFVQIDHKQHNEEILVKNAKKRKNTEPQIVTEYSQGGTEKIQKSCKKRAIVVRTLTIDADTKILAVKIKKRGVQPDHVVTVYFGPSGKVVKNSDDIIIISKPDTL